LYVDQNSAPGIAHWTTVSVIRLRSQANRLTSGLQQWYLISELSTDVEVHIVAGTAVHVTAPGGVRRGPGRQADVHTTRHQPYRTGSTHMSLLIEVGRRSSRELGQDKYSETTWSLILTDVGLPGPFCRLRLIESGPTSRFCDPAA